MPRTVRPRKSYSESGGEEIVYPRTQRQTKSVDRVIQEELPALSPPSDLGSPISMPPSAFPPPRKAKKRTSDEFEFDQAGALVTKSPASSTKERTPEEKSILRKQRSLSSGAAMPAATAAVIREKGKDRRRETIGLPSRERHTRQISSGSSSSPAVATSTPPDLHVPIPPRQRVHTMDFSHLPPSPSSSSIQQFLRTPTDPPAPSLVRSTSRDSQSVVTSLLRGTQEGWSVDDDATAEALRKLDGISKGPRSRTSTSSINLRRSNSGASMRGSRPGTPGTKSASTTAQWEGIESEKITRRASNKAVPPTVPTVSTVDEVINGEGGESASLGVDKTPKKTGSFRSSYSTPKRSSVSSTNYTSTPTSTATSSRDSGILSSATTGTSVSASGSTPGRHSASKPVSVKRSSAGSDISSHSNEGHGVERSTSFGEDRSQVPPVPPLPKDLYKIRSSPQQSQVAFPALNANAPKSNSFEEPRHLSDDSDVERASLEVPQRISTSKPSPLSNSYRHSQNITDDSTPSEPPAVVPRTPSKKWSFTNALNIRLSSSPSQSHSSSKGSAKSPSTDSPTSKTAVTPRSALSQIRRSLSKDRVTSPPRASPNPTWSPLHTGAMGSTSSLLSVTSTSSSAVRNLGSPATYTNTPDRGLISVESPIGDLPSPQGPSDQPLSPANSVRRGHSSRRLTPSSIPFFRRSSSQSMYVPPSVPQAVPESPTFSTSASHRGKSSPKDGASSQSTPPGSHKKSSVLSRGLPGLLKGSSSRRNMQTDNSEAKEQKEQEKQRAKDQEAEVQRLKKEAKDARHEEKGAGRLSVMMGRRRGKVSVNNDLNVARD